MPARDPPAGLPPIPDDPVALRARRHAWAVAVAQRASRPALDDPLVLAWEHYRAAWAALPADVQERASIIFDHRHRCPGLARCPWASKVTG